MRAKKVQIKSLVGDIEGNEEEKVNDWGVTVDLFSHQKNSVKRMEIIEENRIRDYNTEYTSCIVDSNFAILNDKVGSGKTLTMLSMISREVNKDGFSLEQSKRDFVDIYSVHGSSICMIKNTKVKQVNFIPINIIAVPNSIIFQWKEELLKTNLKFKIVTTNAQIKALEQYLYKVNVIVVSKTLYNVFAEHLFQIKKEDSFCVKRLISDEYISRGSFKHIKADFYWLITGTIPKVYEFRSIELRYNFINQCLASSGINFSGRYTSYLKYDHVAIKNSEEEINTSFLVAKVENLVYIAKSKNELFLNLGVDIKDEVKRMIAADDIKGAIEAIGGNIETDSLLKVIIRKEEDKLKEIEASITYHDTLSHHDKKEEYILKLEVAKKRLNAIKERIERDENEGECPLCCLEYVDKCLVECCKNIMCGNCVTKIIKNNKNCPFCRGSIDMKKMIVSTKEEKQKKEKQKKKIHKTKSEYIVDIIKKKPTGKFIIFSEFSNTYDNVIEALKSTGLKYSEVKGTTVAKNNILEKFRNGDLNIIFLNGRSDGAGINLPQTTDIILYHKATSTALETQLIGRALRLGRTSDLKVHRLLYEKEYDMAEDEGAINYLYQRVEEEESDEDDEKENNQEQIESDYQLALRLQNERS
jgi:hypothetical protein